MWQLDSANDFLSLALNIVDKKKKIVIDSGIYNHCDGLMNDGVSCDISDDIIIVKPKHGKYIELSDLVSTMKYMKKQLKFIYENSGRTYYYEGLRKHLDRNDYYVIHWGS